jgi:decaprenyl-phosphate phosphoribosyltransferase
MAKEFKLGAILSVNKQAKPDYLRGHLEICRFDHWIKNVFILPGLLIAISIYPQSINAGLLISIVIGFLAAGLVASSNYVINEILDAPFDALHPTKCQRPTPAGRVHIKWGYVQWIALMLIGLALAALVSQALVWVLLWLWVMGCIYNIPPVRAKDLPYIDVLVESINNPIRLLVGWYIVSPPFQIPVSLLISYWMIGAYLMAIKRFAEMRDISRNISAKQYRKSFGYYTEQNLLVSIMFYAATSMLFFGAFVMRYRLELILSFPLIAFIMAMYLNLAFKEDGSAQAPEKLWKETPLMLASFLCLTLMVFLMNVSWPAFTAFFQQSVLN